MFNLRKDVIVEELQNQRYDNTENGSYQRHLHTRCHNGRTDVASRLNLVESHHHTYHRSQESQRGSQGNEQFYPRTAFLHIGNLHRSVIGQLAVYLVKGLLDVQQTLIADTGHGAASLSAEVFSPLHVVRLQLGINVLHQFLGIHLRECQIDDALNTESQTYHQGKSHQRHKPGGTLDEFRFQQFVQSPTLCRIRTFQIGINERHCRVGSKRIAHHHLR